MKFAHTRAGRRRGAVAPMLALLLVPLVGMIAFALDVGCIVMTTAELQNVADSAALAGANGLTNGYVNYNLSSSTTTQNTIVQTYEDQAINDVKSFGLLNRNADLAAVKLLSADVEFGYTDSSYTYTAGTYGNAVTVGGVSYFPNTVSVTARRDTTSGGNPQLNLYFAGVFGTTKANITVYARAVILAGTIKGLPQNALPMVMDYQAWNEYILDQVDPKDNSGNRPNFNSLKPGQLNALRTMLSVGPQSSLNIKTSDADLQTLINQITATNFPTQTSAYSGGGNQLQAYPSPNLAPGNFGWLSMNDNSNSASDIGNWIKNWLSSSDVSTLERSQSVGSSTDVLFPIKPGDTTSTLTTSHNMNAFDWKGAPGMKDKDIQDVGVNVGAVAYLPLFSPVTTGPNGLGNNYIASLKDTAVLTGASTYNVGGTTTNGADPTEGAGNNAYYNVVDYVPVKITTVDSTGNNKNISVQAAGAMTPGVTFINLVPAGSGTTFSANFAPPRLVSP